MKGTRMERVRVGDTVFLPETTYPDIVGVVLRITGDKCLVNFNGKKQLYFSINELKTYLS